MAKATALRAELDQAEAELVEADADLEKARAAKVKADEKAAATKDKVRAASAVRDPIRQRVMKLQNDIERAEGGPPGQQVGG